MIRWHDEEVKESSERNASRMRGAQNQRGA